MLKRTWCSSPALLGVSLLFGVSVARSDPYFYSEATLSGVTIELRDLNPWDRISPSISYVPSTSFDDYPSSISSEVSGDIPGDGSYDILDISTSDNTWLTGTTRAEFQYESATASILGGSAGTWEQQVLFASANADAPPDPSWQGGDARAQARAIGVGGVLFRLSANTSLRVTGFGTVEFAVSAPASRREINGYAWMSVETKYRALAFDYVGGSFSYGMGPDEVSYYESRPMSMVFNNRSNEPIEASLFISAQAGGRVVSVAEPATYLSLSIGLLALAGLRRRRVGTRARSSREHQAEGVTAAAIGAQAAPDQRAKRRPAQASGRRHPA